MKNFNEIGTLNRSINSTYFKTVYLQPRIKPHQVSQLLNGNTRQSSNANLFMNAVGNYFTDSLHRLDSLKVGAWKIHKTSVDHEYKIKTRSHLFRLCSRFAGLMHIWYECKFVCVQEEIIEFGCCFVASPGEVRFADCRTGVPRGYYLLWNRF